MSAGSHGPMDIRRIVIEILGSGMHAV